MDMMTAEHKLLFMTDDELAALERAIFDEQQRREQGRWIEKRVVSAGTAHPPGAVCICPSEATAYNINCPVHPGGRGKVFCDPMPC